MSEKTAEEKLRQMLEGATYDASTGSKKQKPPARKIVRRAKKKPEAPERVIDSFMEDFERKIEQSLEVGATKTKPEKSQSVKKTPGTERDKTSVVVRKPNKVVRRPEIKSTEALPEIEIVPAQPKIVINEPVVDIVEAIEKDSQQKVETVQPVESEIVADEIKENITDAQEETPPEADVPENIEESIVEPQEPVVEVAPQPEVIDNIAQDLEITPENSAVVEEPVQEETIEEKTPPEADVPENVEESIVEPQEPVIEATPQPEVIDNIAQEPEPELLPEPDVIAPVEEVFEPEPEPETQEKIFEQAPEIENIEPEPDLSLEAIEPPVEDSDEFEAAPEIIPDLNENIETAENLDDVSEVLNDSDENNEEVEVEEEGKEVENEVSAEPEIIPDLDEDLDEEIVPDSEIDELSEEPVIDVNSDEDEAASNVDETTPETLPDIPLIPPEDQEVEREGNLPDIPLINPEDEDNEAPDISGFELDYDDEGQLDEEANAGETENGISSDTPSNADIILNVDSDIPDPAASNYEADPESEIAPVSVTMPESTDTAEDKLMADIAEAMTGSPLSLGSYEAPAAYNLPENFFNDSDSDSSQQSAEDKLMANIAQAMSESPLNVARNIAKQDLENDLNILSEDFTLPPFPTREQPLTEEFNFAEGPEAEIELEPQGETLEESEPEKDNGVLIKEIDTETNDNDDEAPELITEESATESESPAPEPIPEPEEIQEVDKVEDEPEEIAEEPEELVDAETETETKIEVDENINDREIKEVTTENDMPEKSLLDDDEQDVTEITSDAEIEDDEDDFDIASLGALSEATSMPDFEETEIEPTPEENYMPEAISETNENYNELDNDESEEREKVMGIREKLASRKGGAKDDSPATTKKSGKSSSGILLPLLLVILAVIGGFISWQLIQLNDRMTAGMMNYGATGFDSFATYDANPSYDYAVDFIFDTNLTERMAQRGHEGWQVVGSRRTQDSVTGQLGYEFIFMRRTPSR